MLTAAVAGSRVMSVRHGHTSTESKNPAEANLIVRQEETAAMPSRANTAKLLEGKCDADPARGTGDPGKGGCRRPRLGPLYLLLR